MAWKVLWTDREGKRRIKKYPKPAGAVEWAQGLKADGLTAHVVSGTHAYPPNPKAGERPSSKHYWCPYCIKWRVFHLRAIRFEGILSPAELRCEICQISTNDYYVQKYNHLMGTADEKKIYKGIITLRGTT